VDWGTLVATISGAVIAIAGTVLADWLRTRHEDDRGLEGRHREAYLGFISAAGTCHSRLREIAQDPAAIADVEDASRAALADGGVYDARERLFIEASPAVAKMGQEMYERLRELRRVVGTGADADSAAFHGANHPYIESVWAYREAVREELEGQALSPAVFGWSSWDSTARCAVCMARAAEAAAIARADGHRKQVVVEPGVAAMGSTTTLCQGQP
jgi:hypothetical protein